MEIIQEIYFNDLLVLYIYTYIYVREKIFYLHT